MSGKKKMDGAALCDYLPERLPRTRRLIRMETDRFTGFYTGAGSVADGENLSARRYPALATRKPRQAFCYHPGGGTPHGMIRFGHALYTAYGTGLYRTVEGADMIHIATVGDTHKQFFVFGDRLYIYPDKLYIERDGAVPRPMEIDTGVLEQVDFHVNTVTLPEGTSWNALGFEAGDCLRVINADDVNPTPEGYYHIKEVRGRDATVAFTFATRYTGKARMMRTVPTLERYCVNGNRVYGFLGRDVYISGEGSAMDWYSRDRDGTGPAVLHTDTEGDFTACIPWQGYVVFFKSDRICKLMGGRADTFSLQDSGGMGIPGHLAETLCEVNGDLYYHGEGGVYRYRGQDSELLYSTGEDTVTGGCGGTDGLAYYLAVERQGKGSRLYVYSPERSLCYAEDGLSAAFMGKWKGFAWMQAADGYIWVCASDGRTSVGRLDERMVYGELTASVTAETDHAPDPEGFRLVGVYIRATSSKGGSLTVKASYGDGRTATDIDPAGGEVLGVFAGGMRDRLLRLPVTSRLCDSVSLTLLMRGEWIIHNITREYERKES